MIIDTSAKHSLINLENDDSAIYRVVEVHHLFDLFESRLLTLIAPKLWDDPYENFLGHCYGVVPTEPNCRYDYSGYAKLIFGNCWTANQDNDASWRIYSPDRRRVKIRTTVKKLHGLVGQISDDWFRSYLGKVSYLSESEIKANITKAIKVGKFFIDDMIKDFYLKKRDTFSEEKEVRLLVRLVEPGERVANAIYQDPHNPDVCRLPIRDPADLIDEVVFDPRMPDSLVRAYSVHLKTTFNYTKRCLKSKIYESPRLKIEIEKKY